MSMNYKKIQTSLEEINNYVNTLETECAKKTIFFTGGSGYLTDGIKKRLVQAGHTIIAWEEDLTEPIVWDKKAPSIDLIIHFGKPTPMDIDSNQYYQEWEAININMYKFAKQAGCPIINASSQSVELDIPDVSNVVSLAPIPKKDIKTIQLFNAESALTALPNTVISLRIPLVLDESLVAYQPNSWYSQIRTTGSKYEFQEDFYDFYVSNKEEKARGEVPTIPVMSLDRFRTVTLAKIYEVLGNCTGTKACARKETFEYPAISLEVPNIVKKIKAGFWA